MIVTYFTLSASFVVDLDILGYIYINEDNKQMVDIMRTYQVQVSQTKAYDFGAMIHEAAEKLSQAGIENFVHWDSEVTVDIEGHETETVVNPSNHTVEFYLN